MSDGDGPTKRVVYVVSEDLVKVASRLPSNKNRSFLVHSLITTLDLLRPTPSGAPHARIIRPPSASARELAAYHDADYVAFLLDPANSASEDARTPAHARFGLEDDCPPFVGLPAYTRLVGGGALAAARALRSGAADVAIFWDGGRHHATKARAAGFCYVADSVLALLTLSRRLPSPSPSAPPSPPPRVLYLDLDLHFSDGVSRAFHLPGRPATSPSSLLTLSLHHAAPGFFPADALAALRSPSAPDFDPYTLALPLARGASARTFARVWTSCVEPAVRAFAPDTVLVQCGADGLAGDPCAVWNWPLAGADGSLAWCVARALGWAPRVMLVGGGGYHSANTARAWAHLTALALGRPPESDTPVPEHTAFPLYAPSFVLDVPAGHMPDQNTDAQLTEVEAVFERVVAVLRERGQAADNGGPDPPSA